MFGRVGHKGRAIPLAYIGLITNFDNDHVNTVFP
jgi:hypothetical protein